MGLCLTILHEGHFTVKLVWKDFNKEFEKGLGEFRSHVKNVEKETGISNLIEALQERAIIHADRLEDEIQRKSSLPVKVWMARKLIGA